MLISQIDELDAEAEPFENVRDASLELHRFAVRGGNVDREFFADRDLRDSVYVATTRTDIADARRALSRCEFELYFLKVCVSIFFSWHKVSGWKGRYDTR